MKRSIAIGFIVAAVLIVAAMSQSPVLRSLGSISISGTPAVGQVPTATSGTAAAWAIPGLVQIQQITTTSSATAVDFTGIPATYTNLRVIWLARSQQAASTSGLNVKVNADATSGDYTATQFTIINGSGASSNGTVAGSSSGSFVTNVSGTSSTPTATPSTGSVIINSYKGTSFNKRFIASTGLWQTAEVMIQTTGTWLSTAAITEVTFNLGGQAFVDGSVFTLYGEL